MMYRSKEDVGITLVKVPINYICKYDILTLAMNFLFTAISLFLHSNYTVCIFILLVGN
jgi:hypothetical protein